MVGQAAAQRLGLDSHLESRYKMEVASVTTANSNGSRLGSQPPGQRRGSDDPDGSPGPHPATAWCPYCKVRQVRPGRRFCSASCSSRYSWKIKKSEATAPTPDTVFETYEQFVARGGAVKVIPIKVDDDETTKKKPGVPAFGRRTAKQGF